MILAPDGSGFTGTPACDGAVSTGMADLRTALGTLQQTADACVQAMGRHGLLSADDLTTVADAQPSGGDQS